MRAAAGHRRWRRAWLSLCLGLVLCIGTWAADAEPALPAIGAAAPVAVAESRMILALYDSAEMKDDIEPVVAANVELVCDYLGLVLEYRDVRAGLPSHEEMGRYRGILTWFTDWQMANPDAYLQWLIEETRFGRYIVVLGDLGAQQDDKEQAADQALLSQLYALWGFDDRGRNDHKANLVGVREIEEDMFGFEYPARFSTASFEPLEPLPDSKVETLLAVEAQESNEVAGTVVAIHPHGGFAFEPFLMMREDVNYKRKWILNPFRFLARAYRWQTAPRPDFTTLNGARIFYSHVDGDGSVSLCEGKKSVLTVESAVDFYKKLPLPVTLSVVEAEILNAGQYAWLRSDKRPRDAFRKLFAMDSIGPASHGFTHPLDWERGITALTVEGVSRVAQTDAEKKKMRESEYPLTYPLLVAPQAEWEKRETVDAMHFVNTLLPPGKKCRLFLWTGNCLPSEHAIGLVEDAGYLNMNGGDGQFDPETPSYTGLAPAVRHVGDRIQVYTAMANENIYTNDWTRNFSGFSNVIHTLQNTEVPKRVKPINLYYHFYSFEKPAAEAAIRRAYEWSMKQDIAPMFADQYVEWVLASRQVTLTRTANQWAWDNAGKCRTLRFDRCRMVPDMAATTGIIGWYVDTRQDCLYLHLDGSGKGSVRLSADAPKTPHLNRASGWVDDWKSAGGTVSFTFKGYGKSWCELAGLPGLQVYDLKIGKATQRVTTKGDGSLRIDYGAAAFPVLADVVLTPVRP